VGIGIATPHASAKLQIESDNKGFLPPRMNESQRNSMTTSLTPPAGLMVYCTNCGTGGELQVYNGSQWKNLAGVTAATNFVCGTSSVTFTYKSQTVTYGTVSRTYAGSVGTKCWLDRNLGASRDATSIDDTQAYGDYFQWGRGADGHQVTAASLASSQMTNVANYLDQPGHDDFITLNNGNWRSVHNNSLWQGANGENNPCPSGWRLPTGAEWQAELAGWSSQNSAGAFASPLKLPRAGIRLYDALSNDLAGKVRYSAAWATANFSTLIYGYYWSSSTNNNSRALIFASSSAELGDTNISYGMPVRCIKD
jgi:uncharacterized protein (TIGR02145 family)